MNYGAPSIEENLEFLKNNKNMFVLDDEYYSQIRKYENYLRTGNLEDDIVKSSKAKKSILFGNSQSTQVLYENYEPHLTPVKNQGSYGTCYQEAGTLMVEFYIWMHTGKKIVFSRNEVWDAAADSKNKSKKQRQSDKKKAVSGGYAEKAIEALYNFNSDKNLERHYWFSGKSENCKIFKDLIDANLGGFNNAIKVHDTTMSTFPKKLQQYGLMSINFTYGDERHIVTIYASDGSKICCRNSWGNSKKDWTMTPEYMSEHSAIQITSINNYRKNVK